MRKVAQRSVKANMEGEIVAESKELEGHLGEDLHSRSTVNGTSLSQEERTQSGYPLWQMSNNKLSGEHLKIFYMKIIGHENFQIYGIWHLPH